MKSTAWPASHFAICSVLILAVQALSTRCVLAAETPSPAFPKSSTISSPELAASPKRVISAAPANALDVTKFGALGDGITLNTQVIQHAIDTCSAQGGGTLRFPAGRYLTGTIQLKNGVTLYLEDQAVILGSTDAADYRNVDAFIDGTGAELGYALIVTVDAKRVGIQGPGTIDGQGSALKATQNRYTIRPFLVRWVRCEEVVVKDVQLRNSGAWTMHFFQSKNAVVERVSIRSLGLANNDGIDIDSSEMVRITDCDIESGDDAICLKATSALPCRNIIVAGCRLKTLCNAIKLGTESLGNFENIRVSNCQIRDTGMAGIALYSVDGAYLQNVTLTDIDMERVTVPISIRLGARLKTFRSGDKPKLPGVLRGVVIKNLRATGTRRIGMLINGIPNYPVENLALENIEIDLPGGGTLADSRVQFLEKESTYPEMNMFGKIMPAFGIYARHVRGISLKRVTFVSLTPDARPAKVFIDVEGVTPSNFLSLTPSTP